MAILVISSDPDELSDLCDRVLVKAEVRIAREFTAANVTRDAIITAIYAVPEQAGANSRPMPSPPLSGISPPPQGGPRVLRPKCHCPGLVVMIMALSILSPRAGPTVNDFTESAEPDLTRHDDRGGLDPRRRGRRTRSVDWLRGAPARDPGHRLIVSKNPLIPLAVLIVLAAGGLIGLVHGLFVTKVRVNSVIATLGVGTILTGLAFANSAGVPIVSDVPEVFLSLGRGLFRIRNNIVDMALIVVLSGCSSSAPRSGRRSTPSGATPRRLASPAATSNGSRFWAS